MPDLVWYDRIRCGVRVHVRASVCELEGGCGGDVMAVLVVTAHGEAAMARWGTTVSSYGDSDCEGKAMAWRDKHSQRHGLLPGGLGLGTCTGKW